MPLEPLPVHVREATKLPRAVAKFLDDADERIRRWYARHEEIYAAGFVPSDYPAVYEAMRAVIRLGFDPGMFLEWGCGFGVITGLAAMLGHEAHGIEIDEDLVDRARELLEDHHLDAEVHSGSYVPSGYEGQALDVTDFLPVAPGPHAYDTMGLGVEDFDCVFVFPWPGTEMLHFEMFDQHAATGTILVSHHGVDGTQVRRKVS